MVGRRATLSMSGLVGSRSPFLAPRRAGLLRVPVVGRGMDAAQHELVISGAGLGERLRRVEEERPVGGFSRAFSKVGIL